MYISTKLPVSCDLHCVREMTAKLSLGNPLLRWTSPSALSLFEWTVNRRALALLDNGKEIVSDSSLRPVRKPFAVT